MSLSQDIKTLLTDINSNVYRNDRPDKPDNVLVVYNTGGQTSLHAMSIQPPALEKPTFQVFIRNSSYDTAETQAESVKNALNGVTKTNINSNLYEAIFMEGDVLHLGKDNRERTQFSINFLAWVRRNAYWNDDLYWDDNNIWQD